VEEAIKIEQMRTILLSVSETMIQEKTQLTKLDAECGDGDFGIGMFIGFSKAKKTIDDFEGEQIDLLLKKVGFSILSSVGGASGPLFSTFFIAMAEKAKEKKMIDLESLTEMLENSLNKICLRGGAKVGEKTLVDALEPAVRALKEASREKVTLKEALERATQAAKEGVEHTKTLIAKQGKARYLGDKTIGHRDAGAVAIYLMLKSFFDSYSQLLKENIPNKLENS